MFEGKPYFYGTGRRKSSVARVRLIPGTGNVTINGRNIDEYFGLETLIDDRNESAGVKFADADLLGCPIIAIAGKGYMENGEIEIKIRRSGEVRKVQAREAAKEILSLSEKLRSNLLDGAHLE